MNRIESPKSPRPAAGFSLIEVMVSVLVFALGMLGIASLQATALRNSQSAFERSQGVMQTYSILDAMRANRAVAIIDGYDLNDWTCSPPEAGVSLAQDDLNAWMTELQATLGPSACGRIDCRSTECDIEVRWDDSRGTGDADELSEFVVQTSTRL